MSTEPDQLEWIVSGDKVRSRDGDLASHEISAVTTFVSRSER